jgi:hypothetical protein
LKSFGDAGPAHVRLTVLGVALSPDARAISASAKGWKTVPLTCCREPSSAVQSVTPLRVRLCLEVRPAKAARGDALELLGLLLGPEVRHHLGGRAFKNRFLCHE